MPIGRHARGACRRPAGKKCALVDAEAHVDRCATCQATLRLFGAISRLGGPEPASANLSAAVPVRYQLDQRLGRGSQAVVWSARDERLDRDVALKVVSLADPRSRSRFVREGRAVAVLDHANVVKIYDVHKTGELGVLAMELCQRALNTEPLPWPAAIAVFRSVADGLVAIHEAGMVHRDIKPSNLFVSAEGTIKIGDFGLVGECIRAATTGSGDGDKLKTGLVGTPAFMAPELFDGAACTPATDQYAFFASLASVITGAPPTVPVHWPAGSAPRWLQRVVARGLRADPARRFGSMAAAGAALRGPGKVRRMWIPAAAMVAVATVGAAAWPVATPPGPDCTDTSVFTWSDDDREALAQAVGPAMPGNPDAVLSLNDALSQYARQTAALASALCRAQSPNEPGSPGRQCLTRNAERVRAVAKRLTVSPVSEEGGYAALRRLPEVLSFEHCQRTHAGWTPPDPRRPALAAAIHGSWAEELFGSTAQGAALRERALQRPELVAFPDLHDTALLHRAKQAMGGSSPDSVKDDLGAAVRLAAEGTDPTVEAAAWLFQAGELLADSRRAEHELSFARAAVARAGGRLPVSIYLEIFDAMRLEDDGEYGDALKRLDAAVSGASDLGASRGMTSALTQRAVILLRLERHDDAIDQLARARVIAGDGPPHRESLRVEHWMGIALLTAERFEEAIELFSRWARESEPGTEFRYKALRSLLNAYLRAGHFDEAVEPLQSARRLHSQLHLDDVFGRASLDEAEARVAMARGDCQGAVAIMERVTVDVETEMGYEHEVTVGMRKLLQRFKASPPGQP